MSETLTGLNNGNRRYICIYIYVVRETTLVLGYVIWEELSVSHF